MHNGVFLAMIAQRRPISELRAYAAKHGKHMHKPSLRGWLKLGGYDL
jgi:hypothetical protein